MSRTRLCVSAQFTGVHLRTAALLRLREFANALFVARPRNANYNAWLIQTDCWLMRSRPGMS